MTAGWRALTDELDRWASDGRTACFWWRDDDATMVTPALDRLISLHRASNIPLALAIIPALAEPGLAEQLKSEIGVVALQHGYGHRNHAPATEKKSEFPAARALADRLSDMQAGRALLQGLFGSRLLPVFVPPWNRLASDCLPAMAGLGYAALSAFQARAGYWAAPGLATLNTHIDPIDWHGTDHAAAAERSLAATSAHLHAMRAAGWHMQPLGLLTHHLRHDETIWAFVAEFLSRTARHPAVRWLDTGAALKIGAPDNSGPLPVTPTS